MYSTYILESEQGKIYIGSTHDVLKRVSIHNEKGGRWTSKYGKWSLIYQENFDTRSEALKREKKLKLDSE